MTAPASPVENAPVAVLAVLDIDRTDTSGPEPLARGGRVTAVYALDHPAAYERAHDHARNIGGLVVSLGIAIDYRPVSP